MSTIQINELRESLDSLLRFVSEELNINDVPLAQDYYWNIPLDQTYRLDVPAEEIAAKLDVGSLFSDLENLKSVLREPDSRLAFQLTYAASVLRYLGETIEAERLKAKS